ncbi:MAG: hypothetical protein JSU94_12035 [Phycisphaerales bacterium]|nr:MAG: hypothetical protein JSU94_12035 [Phycisphaerales bacterium]
MIEKILGNQVQDILDRSSAKQPDTAKVSVDSRTDALLQANYACLIEKAKAVCETDTKAVQRAKELLLSGRLDTPQNIRCAAERIIDGGI